MSEAGKFRLELMHDFAGGYGVLNITPPQQNGNQAAVRFNVAAVEINRAP